MKVILTEGQLKTLLETAKSMRDIAERANEANLEPTDAQKEAGNYKMGHVSIKGFQISIENPKGSYRKFKNEDGSEGKNKMKDHYGYFVKTKGKDGDAVDVFIGPRANNFDVIFCVDQNNKEGNFDETKVMFGYETKAQAKLAYLSNYSSDWKGFRSITAVDLPTFKKWLYRGRKQRVPFAEYVMIQKKQLKEGKLELDKYYTPDAEAESCIKIFQDCAKENNWNVTEYLEPSAGSGAFSSRLPNCRAFDIKPEAEGIEQADFLTLSIPYQKGRCVIGNPPYGEKMLLAQKFLRKSAELGDYIAFVLPSSQLNNNQVLKNFSLVKSVPLGSVLYSGEKNVNTCFNVYARVEESKATVKTKLNDVTIIRQDNPQYDAFNADIRLGAWGNSVAGRILGPEDRKYAAEYKIKINNPQLRNKIINVLQNADWRKETNSTAMLKIQKFHIINLLKREIPEIQ